MRRLFPRRRMSFGTLPDTEAALEGAVVGSRVVFHDDPAPVLVVAEYSLQLVDHLSASWLSFGGHVRRRTKSPEQTIVIQDLPVTEGGRIGGVRGEEAADVLQAPLPPVFDLGVVGSVGFEKPFVSLLERRAVLSPVVPDENDPSAWPEHACELLPCRRGIEPVKRLPGRDEVHAARRQRRRFCRTRHALESAILREQPFTSAASHRS